MRRITHPLIPLLVLLAIASARAADISIIGPSGPIQPGTFAVLQVSGLSDTDLQKCRVTCIPSDGVLLIGAKTWGGSTILIFQSAKPGKYLVSVSLNPWRSVLNEAVIAVLATGTDSEIVAKLRALVDQAERSSKDPTAIGSASVEVAGGPFPPPPPLPPSIKVTGLYVLVVHDPQGRALPQAQANIFTARTIRDWLASNCTKDKAETPAFRFLVPGSDVARETDPAWWAAMRLQAPPEPYWVLIDDKHMVVEALPKTVADALARLESFKGGN
jgi:hypothetical protein